MEGVKYYLKVYMKNIFMYLLVIFLFGLGFLQGRADINNLYKLTIGNSFLIIGSSIVMNLLTVYVVGKEFEILNFINQKKEKVMLEKYLAGILMSFILFIIPFIILLTAGAKFDYYSLKVLLNFFLIWMLANILSITIATFISVFIKNNFKYIASVSIMFLIFLFKMIGFFQIQEDNIMLMSLFHVLDDKITSPINTAVMLIFNRAYFLDKLFIIVIIIFLLVIIYNSIRNKNKYIYILSLVIFIGTEFLIINQLKEVTDIVYPEIYDYVDIGERDKPFEVTGYSMDLKLRGKLENNCLINVVINKELEELVFNLSDKFTIDKLKINGKDAEYKLSQNKLYIRNNNLAKECDISINYSGRIDIKNPVMTDVAYVNNRDIMLRRDKIDWYPTILSKNEVESYNFRLTIDSLGKIYSNLDILEEKDKEGNRESLVEGLSEEVILLSGNYELLDYDDMDIVMPKLLKIDQMEASASSILERLDSQNIDRNSYKRIIYLPYEYNSMDRKMGNDVFVISN